MRDLNILPTLDILRKTIGERRWRTSEETHNQEVPDTHQHQAANNVVADNRFNLPALVTCAHPEEQIQQ